MSAIGRTRRPCPPLAGERGFTLLEMLVTLGIMALIAGIGFPAIDRMRRAQAVAAADQAVTFALVQARADAQGRGTAVRLALAPDGRAIGSTARAPAPLPAGLALSWPTGGITFFADGTASGGTVAIADAGRARRLAVDPALSRIAVAR